MRLSHYHVNEKFFLEEKSDNFLCLKFNALGSTLFNIVFMSQMNPEIIKLLLK